MNTSSISNQFTDALNLRAKEALTRLVQSTDVVHVGEIRQVLVENPELGVMTIAELFGKSPKSKPALKIAETIADVNVRTADGRQAFDALVLKTLKSINGGQNVAAAELQVGGTNIQRLASLNRLIETGEVTFTGRARSTRYSVA